MAVKPDIDDTRWAETAAGVPNSGEIVEPNSGKKDIGWADAELPPHEFFNHLHNAQYQVNKYLLDGDFDGPINVDGTLAADSVTADDFFYGAAGASPRSLAIPAAAFSGVGSTSTVDTWVFSQTTNGSFAGAHWEKIASTDVWISAPVLLDAGTTISGISLYQDRNGETVDFRLVQTDLVSGTRTVVATQSISTGSGRAGAAIVSGLPHELVANSGYAIEVDSTNSGSAVFGAVVSHYRAP